MKIRIQGDTITEVLTEMKKYILASASPRRKELLEKAGLVFKIVVPETDESSVSKELDPGLYVQELALLKAGAAAKKCGGNSVIIGADTVVTLDNGILGKPKDEADAFRMLRSLSGRTHEVYTGFCVMDKGAGTAECRSVMTKVTFRDLSDKEIYYYIATGEPMDKAGAYGIQGLGGKLVSSVEGDFDNVVGLPVKALMEVLGL